MRHISHLSEVQLCVIHREFKTKFTHIRWPGSRKARIALDRAVGRMHLDDWKNQNVGNPISYFIIALSEITRNATNAPGQSIVEQVLSATFPTGFSATLKQRPFSFIHTSLRNALSTALAPTGAINPITPGFEDMLPDTPGKTEPGAPAPGPGSGAGPGSGGGGPGERDALEEALGAGFIDYFNGHYVDSVNEAFEGYGGTDLHIRNALKETFEHNFDSDFTKTLRKVDVGPTASVAMKALANEFATALKTSIANNPHTGLYPVFADLTSIKYP